jgi:hypothetical protein
LRLQEVSMRVEYEPWCGLDVHKTIVVACVIVPNGNGRVEKGIRTFRTLTEALRSLTAWLQIKADQEVVGT